MPSSQQWIPFKRKDIAKAFFDHDISGGPSTANKAPGPRNLNCRGVTPATNHAKANNSATFLTLPVEIRLQIYDLLLVSRFDRTQNPSWAVGNTYQKVVSVDMVQAPQYRTMEPGVLRTCKQVYHEANTILYSQNIFAFNEPEKMIRFVGQVGLVNVKLVKRLHLWVPWMAELAPWLQLLHFLAEEATGLRSIGLGWDAICDFSWHLERGAKERGLGDNLDFVRTLGNIQRLENLVIEGYYAKNWPAYLERRMGMRVRAIYGHCCEENELRVGDPNDEELEDTKLTREYNEEELQLFREFQQGTEDLIP